MNTIRQQQQQSSKTKVTNEKNRFKFQQASSAIAGTADSLKRQLAKLDAELKQDIQGRKEFEEYLTRLQLQRADLQDRINKNNNYIEHFEASKDDGAFESQYKKLLEEIQQIYESAKEFHSKGLDMLIKEFGYHIAYKRWNDTFTAVPFKPK